jgi:hypothetical protein
MQCVDVHPRRSKILEPRGARSVPRPIRNQRCIFEGTRSRRGCEWAFRWTDWGPVSIIARRDASGVLTGRGLPTSRRRGSEVLGGKI